MRLPSLKSLPMAAGRYRDALIDPAGSARTVLFSLAVYVLLWTIYGAVAKGSQGLHYDMTEVMAGSRDLSFGYLRHPPLAAWLARGWFSVLPFTETSYYMLAMLMPALALWFAWLASEDYLDIEKRIAGIALLTLIPFFNFHALKFNSNTVLMPVWAATTFWFLRSYQTRSKLYAVLAGLGAAACMLGKYWSVFLLAGLAVAALIDERRGQYFRSAAPWITVAAGLIVLAPHIGWLVQHDFAPFGYAMTVHGNKTLASSLKSIAGYLAGSVGYVAIPWILVAVAAWPGRAVLADMFWPRDPGRRWAVVALLATLLLPIGAALLSGSEITSLWSMSAWTLLPVLLLSPPAIDWRAIDTRRVLAAAVAVPLIMLIAAPFIAIAAQLNGPKPAAAHAQHLAQLVERAWRGVTPLPLRFVGGDVEIAYGVITYAGDKPRALPDMVPPDAAELARSGMALVCFAEDGACARQAAAHVGAIGAANVTIARDYLWISGKPRRYAITIVPPR